MSGRLLRTIRPLSATQLAHRVRLRTRAAARRALGRSAARLAADRAGPVPPIRRLPSAPVDLLRPCDPDVVEERADRAARREFSFVGLTRTLPDEIFPAPTDVPLLWAYHLEYMEYLLDLGLTGREEALAALVRARIATEDAPRISATHPYPESRRTASFLRVLTRGGGDVRAGLALSAWTWSHRILANLEWDVGGNHLLENGLALVLAGATFTGRRGRRLLDAGERILTGEVGRQVNPDGSHYELSLHYHARVLQVLTEGGSVLDAAGRPPPLEYWDALARMAAFLRDLLDPDGQIPLFGDAVRDPDVEPARLVAAAAGRIPVAIPPAENGDRGWADGGIYRLGAGDRGHRMMLDAGPTCPERLPAHGQADTFTYELHVDGKPMVVDSGLFEYRAGEMRDWCRATRAHNTVEVDGESSSEVWSSFRIGRRARVRDRRFRVDRGRGTISAWHDGYGHRGVRHLRVVSRLGPGLWLVADRILAAGRHRSVSRIHLHPEAILERGEGSSLVAHLAGAALRVVPFGPVRLGVSDGWHCPAFGVRRRTAVVEVATEACGPAFGYVLAAEPAGEIEVLGEGSRVRIRHPGGVATRAVP